jgi:hypothetical protein
MPHAIVPSWLDEGLASYMADEDRYAWLQPAIVQDRIIPLRSLDTFPRQVSDAYLLYGEGQSVVRFLAGTRGIASIADLLAAYKGGATSDTAFLQVYGLDRDGIEAQWRESIGAFPAHPASTPAAAGQFPEPDPTAPSITEPSVNPGGTGQGAKAPDSISRNLVVGGGGGLLLATALGTTLVFLAVRRRRSLGSGCTVVAVTTIVLVLALPGIAGLVTVGSVDLDDPDTMAAILAITPTPTATPSATSTPSPTRTPTATPTAIPSFTPAPAGAVIFSDDLSTNRNGWETYNTSGSKAYFQNGSYHVENLTAGSFMKVAPGRGVTAPGDFDFEAELTRVSGPDTGAMGIAFRTNGSDGYYLTANESGSSALQRYSARLLDTVPGPVHWDSLSLLTDDPGLAGRPNDISFRVVANGQTITSYINDTWRATDTDYRPDARLNGSIGIYVGSGMHVIVRAVRLNALP